MEIVFVYKDKDMYTCTRLAIYILWSSWIFLLGHGLFAKECNIGDFFVCMRKVHLHCSNCMFYVILEVFNILTSELEYCNLRWIQMLRSCSISATLQKYMRFLLYVHLTWLWKVNKCELAGKEWIRMLVWFSLSMWKSC